MEPLVSETNSRTTAEAAAVERPDFDERGKFRPGNSFAWPKGVSGNVQGRRGSISDYISRRLDEVAPGGDGRTHGQIIVDVLISLGEGGNIQAIKELIDRKEGRPRQQVDLGFAPERMSDSEIQQALIEAGVDVDELARSLDERQAAGLLGSGAATES